MLKTKGKQGTGARLDQVDVENGCNLSHDCFTCIFPDDCKIKHKDVLRTPKARAEAGVLFGQGFSDEEIARRLNQRLATVKRWLNST